MRAKDSHPSDRPFIIVNLALTAQGSMVSAPGELISCPADWQRVHLLREMVDGVAVGRLTWERDQPRLSCRAEHLGRAPRRQPGRVIFAGSGAVDAGASTEPIYVVGRPDGHTGPVIPVPALDHDLADPLKKLFQLGLRSLLVEGGAALVRSFLRQGCVDRIHVYVACRDPKEAQFAAERAFPEFPPAVSCRRFGEGTLLGYRGPDPAQLRNGGCRLPAGDGDWRVSVYRFPGIPGEHAAFQLGTLQGPPPLVRIHSECLTGDVFGSRRCDCGQQLRVARRRIVRAGRGLILYLRQEGRGIGLLAKAMAYGLQDRFGLDTVEANLALGYPADGRDYRVAALILEQLGVQAIRLLTNNATKAEALEHAGIRVHRVPFRTRPSPHNHRYLITKVQRMGHDATLIQGR
jgi:GTP cyclohydrolase II